MTEVSTTTTPSTRHSYWMPAVLILLYLLLYLMPLGVRPLLIPDESRYAEIPREILSTGDWVVPHYNGLRYFEKPPLGYWVNAGSIAIFGETAFAARLPSAIAAGLTTLLVFFFARNSFRSQRLAIYAALIHMSFFEVYLVGTISVLDNLLALLLSAGIVAFYMAARADPDKRAWLYWILSGISLGLAFLAKGFLALALPVLVLVPWMLWQGKWRSLFTHGWLVVLVAALVATPWALMVHLRESDFWHYFFWIEHVQRFTADNAQHKAPFYYYLVALPLLAFPWFSFAPAAIKGLSDKAQNPQQQALLRFLWLWLLLPIGFFSISSGKLATYILPCFPPLALLLAAGIEQYLQRSRTGLFTAGLFINFTCFAVVLLALVLSQSMGAANTIYDSDEMLSYLAVAISLIAILAVIWFSLKSRSTQTLILGAALSVIPVVLIAHLAFPDQASEHKSPSILVREHISEIPDNAIVIADSYIIGSVAWALNRHDIYLSSPGELAYGLDYPDAKHRLLTAADMSALVKQQRGTRPIALLCSDGCAESFTPALPADAIKYSYGIFDLWIMPALNDKPIPGNIEANSRD